MPTKISVPAEGEFAEFYGGYVQYAMARDDVFEALSQQIEELTGALGGLTDAQALFRDAPGEWTIKEVMGHINDVERVFSYRLLRISRNDPTPLPGFEQDDFVRESAFNSYPIQDLVEEFRFMRQANLLAIQNLSEEAILRCGTASGMTVSVRALIYMLVGHVEHHMASLREKYLPTAITL